MKDVTEVELSDHQMPSRICKSNADWPLKEILDKDLQLCPDRRFHSVGTDNVDFWLQSPTQTGLNFET
jgi:hypothetical protein